jgi:hypothetical protein
MKNLVIAAPFLLMVTTSTAATYYEIQVAHNDELFIINGEKFEAKTFCLGWDEGDRVIFVEGSALGAALALSSTISIAIRHAEFGANKRFARSLGSALCEKTWGSQARAVSGSSHGTSHYHSLCRLFRVRR